MSLFTRLRKYNENHDELGRFAAGGGSTPVAMTMTQVTAKKGSNDGGVYADALGTKYYVKFYKNPDQARTEELSSSLFEMLGCRTPGPKTAMVNGKHALVTPWADTFENLSPSEFGQLNDKQKNQVGRMFMGAVLTKNWDVVGTGMDNIVRDKKTGDMVEVDTGGSFKFRAQGAPKPYDGEIPEAKTLLDVNVDAGKVFSKVFNSDPQIEQNSLLAVKKLDMRAVKAKFAASGLPDAMELYDSFRSRRAKLLEGSNL